MKTNLRLPSGHSKSARQRTALLKSGVYQIKVVLARSEPLIWRRILVPGDFTLAALHEAARTPARLKTAEEFTDIIIS